jgi:DNA-binding beta-propeller fold protein YncE
VGGPVESELKEPRGLGLDRNDYLYLADTGNDRVLKIAQDGRLVAQWGSGGTGKGQFRSPVGIAVSDKGAVFVVDKDNLRIQEFRVPSKTP